MEAPQQPIENDTLSNQFWVMTVDDLEEKDKDNKSQKQIQKLSRKSIFVSMIEDDDIINDYFLPSTNQNIQLQNQHQQPKSPLKNTPKPQKQSKPDQSKLIAEIINPMSPSQSPQNPKDNHRQKVSPAKRSFHYQSTKASNESFYNQFSNRQSIVIEPIVPHQKQYHTSRLVLQKEKYNLHFDQISGQIFIYIAQGELIGSNKLQPGYFLLTNYRIIFFKFIPELNQTKKRVDLPFGFAKKLQYIPKRKQVVFYLHYDHYWKFNFQSKQDFQKIMVMLQLYAKNKDIKSAFAFSYALKVPEFQKFKYDLLKEYMRMRLSDVSMVFPNEGFKLSQTYPQYIVLIFYDQCLPQQLSEGSKQVIKSICQNFKGNRLPVLTFKLGNNEDWAGLWLSGTYVEDHKINQKQLKTYFSHMRGQDKKRLLYVYDCYYKQGKTLLESSLDNKFENRWLNLCANWQIKTSYDSIVQAYLMPKNSFFTDVIASKWYDMILQLLKSAFEISQKLMVKESVLIKEDSMNEKSLIISALVQLILQPFYRTFKGFKYLIMKDFIGFGFKFASRLGNREPEDACPTFIQFLDAVSQLIQLNPFYFEFNSKYLAKISHLMYTNIFGTFLADSPKQFYQAQILQMTVQIWSQLESELTTNPFYDIKNGVLMNHAHTTSDIRFWTEHFGYLTSQPKDWYKLHPLAESTADYVPLECLKLKVENNKLKSEVQKQRNDIVRLRQYLEKKRAGNK